MAVPRSDKGAKMDTSAGRIVSRAVKPAKNSTSPTPSSVSETAPNATIRPSTVSNTVRASKGRGSSTSRRRRTSIATPGMAQHRVARYIHA